jgi:hypothetical protein
MFTSLSRTGVQRLSRAMQISQDIIGDTGRAVCSLAFDNILVPLLSGIQVPRLIIELREKPASFAAGLRVVVPDALENGLEEGERKDLVIGEGEGEEWNEGEGEQGQGEGEELGTGQQSDEEWFDAVEG